MFAISEKGDWKHEERELCMVWDCYSDKPERFYKGAVIGPLADAIAHIEERPAYAGRLVIIKCQGFWPVPTQQLKDRREQSRVRDEGEPK